MLLVCKFLYLSLTSSYLLLIVQQWVEITKFLILHEDYSDVTVTVPLMFNLSWIKTPCLSSSFPPYSLILSLWCLLDISKVQAGWVRSWGWEMEKEVGWFSDHLLSPLPSTPEAPNQEGAGLQVASPPSYPPNPGKQHSPPHMEGELFFPKIGKTVKYVLSPCAL